MVLRRRSRMFHHLHVVVKRRFLNERVPLVKAILVHGDAVHWRLMLEKTSWISSEHVALVLTTNLTYWRCLP